MSECSAQTRHIFETRALGVLAIGPWGPSVGMFEIVGDFLGIGRVLQPVCVQGMAALPDEIEFFQIEPGGLGITHRLFRWQPRHVIERGNRLGERQVVEMVFRDGAHGPQIDAQASRTALAPTQPPGNERPEQGWLTQVAEVQQLGRQLQFTRRKAGELSHGAADGLTRDWALLDDVGGASVKWIQAGAEVGFQLGRELWS